MPFLFRSVEHMRKSLDGPVGEEILKSCEAQGFVGLAFYDSGARSIYGKKPVKTLADAKGMKIRVQQSDLWVALVSAMGANATPMPYRRGLHRPEDRPDRRRREQHPVLRRLQALRGGQVLLQTEHSMAPEMLLMSQGGLRQAAQGRPGDVPRRGQGIGAFQRKKWDEQEAKSLDVVKEGGAQIVEVDKASFQAVMAPVYDKFMTTPDLKRLVKAVQDTK